MKTILALAMICLTVIICTCIWAFRDDIPDWIEEKAEERRQQKKAVGERQLRDGTQVRLDGKKVEEIIKGAARKASHDNTP